MRTCRPSGLGVDQVYHEPPREDLCLDCIESPTSRLREGHFLDFFILTSSVPGAPFSSADGRLDPCEGFGGLPWTPERGHRDFTQSLPRGSLGT